MCTVLLSLFLSARPAAAADLEPSASSTFVGPLLCRGGGAIDPVSGAFVVGLGAIAARRRLRRS